MRDGAIGAEFLEFDVDGLVKDYVMLFEQAVGRKLTWQSDDIALQNIQARARAPGVWLLANLKNALPLATSNRAEATVGYATMDDDTCGGLPRPTAPPWRGRNLCRQNSDPSKFDSPLPHLRR